MFVGIGVGVGRQRFASGINVAKLVSDYNARVIADGGIVEATGCVISNLNILNGTVPPFSTAQWQLTTKQWQLITTTWN